MVIINEKEDPALVKAAAWYVKQHKQKGYIFSDEVKGIKCYHCGFFNENYRELTEFDEYWGFQYFCPKCNKLLPLPSTLNHANFDVVVLKDGINYQIKW